MRDNEKLIEALENAVENCPEVELVKFIRYIGSIDDMSYLSDSEIAEMIEYHNQRAKDTCDLYDYIFNPNEMNSFEIPLSDTVEGKYSFTKENEQIAYERYETATFGRNFFDLVEKVNMKDFLERFNLEFVNADEYREITVINHKDNFLNRFPMAYRHMNGYVVARKGDQYIAKHVYLVKNPCFGELMDYAMQHCKDEYDECLVIVIDWDQSPRFVDYTRHIMYGLEYRKNEKVVEIYNDHQTIEKFHTFFQQANKIVSDWKGVLYDDGSCGLE